MHGGPDGAHHHGGHQIARDGGRRLHVEQQNEHRRHQGSTAGPGHSDQEPDDGAAQDDVRIHAENLVP